MNIDGECSPAAVDSCERTGNPESESDSDDEFITIKKSGIDRTSAVNRESITADTTTSLHGKEKESSISKASLPPPVDSESDEPISIRSKPTKSSKPKRNTKKRSTKKKAPKKAFDMPGQKKDTPGELNGARIFYESLREQIPDSKMAEEYLLKYGLLPRDEAAAIVEAQLNSKGKSSTARKATQRSNTEKSSKRKRIDKLTEIPSGEKRIHKMTEIPSGESSSDEEIILTKKKKFI